MIDDVTPPKRSRPKPKVSKLPAEPQMLEPTPAPEEPVADQEVVAPEPAFKTPDEIAAEEAGAALANEEAGMADSNAKSHRSFVKPSRRWLPHTRKQWIITSAVAVVVLCGIGGGWVFTHKPAQAAPKHAVVVKKRTPPKPKPIYSDLSGLQITDPSLNKKPVTAVMVENSTDARPQSGLSQAGVVFEAQAEGGVTRFMALYQDTAPNNVGPIRSARPYYIQWALGFDAAYAHVGGSPDALKDITSWGVQDMNQFAYGGSYHRISSRPSPHNVYTGIDTLNQLETAKNYSSTFTGFPRADKPAPLAQPTASSISLSVSGPLYNPHFDYDTASGTYKRSTNGKPDTDANTGQQLSPTVVISIVVPLSRGALDASGAYYSNYNVLGSGTAYVFQNGGVTKGQWHKADNATQITFTDASGNAIPLNRGQTWITAVSSAGQVGYKGSTAAN